MRISHQVYSPTNMLITAAGNLDHTQITRFGGRGVPPSAMARMRRFPRRFRRPQAHLLLKTKKALEQIHICLGVPCLPHRTRIAVRLLHPEHGSGRRHELAAVSKHPGAARPGVLGFFGIESLPRHRLPAGKRGHVVERRPKKSSGSTLEEFRRFKEELVSDEELRRAKDHLKGSLMLSLESTSSRMANLARQELYFGTLLQPGRDGGEHRAGYR